jgi:hypothetical protein
MGRSTPWMRRRVKMAAARTAPLFPAETAPAALPSRTSSCATVMLLRFLARTASTGCSSMPITSSAWTISRSSPCVSCLASSCWMVEWGPTGSTLAPKLACRLHGAKHHLAQAEIATHRVEGGDGARRRLHWSCLGSPAALSPPRCSSGRIIAAAR